MCHLDGKNHALGELESNPSTGRYDIGSTQNNSYSHSQSRYNPASSRNDQYGG